MSNIEIRSIVVATDLGPASDRLVRTASSIAALTGAELHVVHVHVVPTAPHIEGSPEAGREAEAVREAEALLDEQVRRAIPPQFTPSSQMVLARSSPSEAIRRHAEELSSDLIVLGPHRGPMTDRSFLGTTADRLVSTAGVPCLIVRDGPEFPMQQMGVLVDFSPAAQAALDTAAAWLLTFSGGRVEGAVAGQPRVSVAHIAWTPQGSARSAAVEAGVQPELDRAVQRTQMRMGVADRMEFQPEVLHAGDATQVVGEWVRERGISLLVLGTRGTSRLPYVYLGGLASALARSAPCSVLLVPPDYAPEALTSGSEERIRLRRIITGVDFHDPSWEAAVWAMRHLAPDAEHELIHVIDPPDLPGPLRALGGKREQLRLAARGAAQRRLQELRELGACPTVTPHVQPGRPAPEILRLADEVDVDLIVVGEQGPARGINALLGSTAERVLFESRIPVLVARKLGDSPPRSLLVAIDTSEASARVLEWTAALLERYDASAVFMNVVDRLLLADEISGIPEAETLRQMEAEATIAMREWLQQQIDAASLPAGRVRTLVAIGDPSYEIISQAQRGGADLVLVGSRGGDISPTPLIGRIVNKVVRSAPCSVLVVTKGV